MNVVAAILLLTGAVINVPNSVMGVPGAVTGVPGAVTGVAGAVTGVRATEECLCPEGSSSDAPCSCPPRLKTDQPIVITLTNLSGTIVAPEDPSGDHYYCTNCRVLWVLDTGAPSNTITLTIQDLFLGYPDVTIPDADLNYTTGDFLLVGAGNDILQGNELMFFGHRQQPQKVMIPAGVGHIFLYSTVSAADAKGFNITYNTTVEVTTEAPPSTTTRAPNIPETYVAVNGIPLTDWQSYNESFKKNIAIMSNGYLNQHGFSDNLVSEDMVFIHDIKTCNPFTCKEDCVAYLFSVDLIIGGSIVFSKNMLDLMLADPQLQQCITNITGTSQMCDEHPSESVTAYVVVPIMVVVIALIISLVICRCSRHDDITEKQQKYEKEQQERLEDQRKRSSGIVSILGIGTDTRHGSASSGPFSKAPADDDDDLNNPFDGEGIDMTDFMEYDPDFVGVNPSDFGLEKEFMTTRRPMTFYNNDAFEEDEATVYQRAPSSSHSIAATDSDDSGDGDALSFQRSTRHHKMHFIIPAEIHAKEDANETVL